MDEVICPYCNGPAHLVDSKQVYKARSYGNMWLCEPCEAWVGCHKGTSKPLGRLADAELRRWKRGAHQAFDALWQRKISQGHPKRAARDAAYAWLSEKMAVPARECHIGMFDVALCQDVIRLCWRYLNLEDRRRVTNIICTEWTKN